jgi:hypothetical protein
MPPAEREINKKAGNRSGLSERCAGVINLGGCELFGFSYG